MCKFTVVNDRKGHGVIDFVYPGTYKVILRRQKFGQVRSKFYYIKQDFIVLRGSSNFFKVLCRAFVIVPRRGILSESCYPLQDSVGGTDIKEATGKGPRQLVKSVNMARHKWGRRTPDGEEVPKEKTFKKLDTKVVEDKRKSLEEHKELLTRYDREYTAGVREFAKGRTRECRIKKDQAGQAWLVQQVTIKEILVELGRLNPDESAAYAQQEREFEEYLQEFDKKITAINNGVYEDVPEEAGTGTQQETEQGTEVAEESNWMDYLCEIHDRYGVKAYSCAEPDTCPLAEWIRNKPKKKKRRTKPVRASPTEPGMAEELEGAKEEPFPTEPEPELSPVAKAEEDARLKAETEAKARAQEEARFQAEEEVKLKAEEEARLKAEEEARIKAETEAKTKAEEEARFKAKEEARLKVEEKAKLKAETEAKAKTEEEVRLRAKDEAKLKADEEASFKAEAEIEEWAELELSEITPETDLIPVVETQEETKTKDVRLKDQEYRQESVSIAQGDSELDKQARAEEPELEELVPESDEPELEPVEPEPKSETEPRLEMKPVPGPESEPEPRSETEPVPEEPGPRSETEPGPEMEPEPGPESEPEPGSETGPRSGVEPEPGPGPESEPEPELELELSKQEELELNKPEALERKPRSGASPEKPEEVELAKKDEIMEEIAKRLVIDSPKSDTTDNPKSETREEPVMATEVQPGPPEPLMRTEQVLAIVWAVWAIVWAMWAFTRDTDKPRGCTENTREGTHDNNWTVWSIVWAMWAIIKDAGKSRGGTEDTQGSTHDNNWTDRLCKGHGARSREAYSSAEWEKRSVIREINNFY